jgi:Ser/Thr protein kinase RdoA (MazF antagonist)
MRKPLPDFNFENILAAFALRGSITSVQPYGSGHINDTFYLKNSAATAPDYLLQRVNHHVFKDVPALMQNVQRVTAHLRDKLITRIQTGATEVLTLVPAHNGECFYQDPKGNYWRVFHFLKDTTSYDLVSSPDQAEAGGVAFGQFLAVLADLPADALTETIPDFHNIEKRLISFHTAVLHDSRHRVAEVLPEIRFVEAREHAMGRILRRGKEGSLPLRITHNDTKFNNVLFDANNKAQCVIDLDTVMPGYAAYDFGDAIRTLVNTAAEDEKDLEKIDIDLPLFDAFANGFLQETHGFLTPAEIQSLPWGVLLLPYLMGVRFLTDYLQGDIYYKTSFTGHNLQRCKAQFQLLRKLEAHYTALEDSVNKIAATYTGSSVKEKSSVI